MVSTTFVTLASLQLLILFVLWAPIGGVRWQPSGFVLGAWAVVYTLAWIFLGIATWNAGLATQMGYLGWWSVWRGREPSFGEFPTHGLDRVCRHPVYFAMALVSLTGPVWTVDHLLVAAIFCAYCLPGPQRKGCPSPGVVRLAL
jgi:steroid 5-alpha reductase family enzyme